VCPPNAKLRLLAGIVVERCDAQDDVRLGRSLGNQMRSAYRAEVTELAG
jgi:hypothetical protein